MPCVPKTYCHSLPPTTCSIPPRCGHQSSWSQLVSQPQKYLSATPSPVCPPAFPPQSHSCFSSVKATPMRPTTESPIISCVPKSCCQSRTTCALPPLCGTQTSYSPFTSCPPLPSCSPIFPVQSLTYKQSGKNTPSCPPIKSSVMPCAPKTCCHLPYPPATCCLPPPCGPRASCRRLVCRPTSYRRQEPPPPKCPPTKCPPVTCPRNCS